MIFKKIRKPVFKRNRLHAALTASQKTLQDRLEPRQLWDHANQNSLVLDISCLLFKPKPCVRAWKEDLGGGVTRTLCCSSSPSLLLNITGLFYWGLEGVCVAEPSLLGLPKPRLWSWQRQSHRYVFPRSFPCVQHTAGPLYVWRSWRSDDNVRELVLFHPCGFQGLYTHLSAT